MKRCDPRAYTQCPDHERCGPNIYAHLTGGSECDKFNQRVLETPMANGDRIRSMSDEELAKFLDDSNSQGCVCLTMACAMNCQKCIKKWLKQPVKEEET